MSRPRLGWALAAGALVVLGAAAVLVWLGGAAGPDDAERYAGSEPPAGIALSRFSLESHDGGVVHSADLDGRVTVLTFLDSQCTESCPVIAWTIARALDTLTRAEREEVRAIAISTDPAEDTPPRVSRFLARNRAVGRLLYVGGGQPESELRRVWSEFDVLSSLESGSDSLHSAPVRIYDRRRLWVSTLHAGADLTEASLAHDIRRALGR